MFVCCRGFHNPDALGYGIKRLSFYTPLLDLQNDAMYENLPEEPLGHVNNNIRDTSEAYVRDLF